MTSRPDQGLGSSLALYLSALFGGLMLFVLPVYFLNAGTNLQNPGLAAYVPPPGATLIRKPDPYTVPLAILKRDDVVDPAQLAAINAKAQKTDKPRRSASRSVPRQRGEPDLRYAAQPQPRSGFLFGLF
jgi:hypothetical protein